MSLVKSFISATWGVSKRWSLFVIIGALLYLVSIVPLLLGLSVSNAYYVVVLVTSGLYLIAVGGLGVKAGK